MKPLFYILALFFTLNGAYASFMKRVTTINCSSGPTTLSIHADSDRGILVDSIKVNGREQIDNHVQATYGDIGMTLEVKDVLNVTFAYGMRSGQRFVERALIHGQEVVLKCVYDSHLEFFNR